MKNRFKRNRFLLFFPMTSSKIFAFFANFFCQQNRRNNVLLQVCCFKIRKNHHRKEREKAIRSKILRSTRVGHLGWKKLKTRRSKRNCLDHLGRRSWRQEGRQKWSWSYWLTDIEDKRLTKIVLGIKVEWPKMPKRSFMSNSYVDLMCRP